MPIWNQACENHKDPTHSVREYQIVQKILPCGGRTSRSIPALSEFATDLFPVPAALRGIGLVSVGTSGDGLDLTRLFSAQTAVAQQRFRSRPLVQQEASVMPV